MSLSDIWTECPPPTLFDAAGPEPSHSGLVLRRKLREKASTGERGCDTQGPAWASTGVTHTGQHGPAQVRHKLRGGGEPGRGAAAARQLQQRRALPHPTFFVLFFYLANISGLVVVPSPDLLTYFNVIKCNSNNFL